MGNVVHGQEFVSSIVQRGCGRGEGAELERCFHCAGDIGCL